MPVFGLPLALFGLAALPVAVAVYALRSRSRRRLVSSLILWSDLKQARTSGIRIRNMHFPLILLLELLILAVAVLAMADPRVPVRERRSPLVVILDDSYRMTARAPDGTTSRSRAIEAVVDEVTSGRHFPVYLVAAGPRPRLVDQPIRSMGTVRRSLENWHCRSRRADFDRALTFAARTAPPGSRVIVVTDRPPAQPPSEGGLVWWAFGRKLDNRAVTAALRNDIDGHPRLMVEVSNFSDQPQQVRLGLEGLPGGTTETEARKLDAGQTARIFRDLPTGAGRLTLRLPEDALVDDNTVVLLEPPDRTIRVVLDIENEDALLAVRRALSAHRHVRLVSSSPELLVTDRDDANPVPDRWVLQLVLEKPDDAGAYTGPYVVDRAHPLAEGLAPEGVVWATTDGPLPGVPVLMVGDIPLVTVRGRRAPHHARLRACLALSSLTSSPNWPILLSNMVDWRSRALPGLEAVNLRLGTTARLVLPRGTRQVSLLREGEPPMPLSAAGRLLFIEADRLGVHTVSADTGQFRFAVNALSPETSDLRGCVTRRWGTWLTAEVLRREYRSASWLLLVVVIGLLALHQWMVRRSSRGGDLV